MANHSKSEVPEHITTKEEVKFIGIRKGFNTQVKIDYGEGAIQELKPEGKHSPDGFNWGYGGSGPAELALVICKSIMLDEELAEQVYQDVKWAVIAKIQTDTWVLPIDIFREAIIDSLSMRGLIQNRE